MLTRRIAVFTLCAACRTRDAGDDERLGMVHVPAGAFARGCDIEREGISNTACKTDPEVYVLLNVPYRQIELSEFWIDKYEATRQDWTACVSAGVCLSTSLTTAADATEARFPAAGPTWEQAKSYCEWRGKRLPTEAEWEKAARGTDGRRYPWGDDEPACDTAHILHRDDEEVCERFREFLPVDAYPGDRSPYGAIGMVGSVQEWTSDWAGEQYYDVAPGKDPLGPDTSDTGATPDRVIRGTHWDGPPYAGRTYQRWWLAPDASVSRVGARCASSLPPDEIDDPLAPP